MLFSTLSHASALYFYEIGTEDTALAGAGQAARAQMRQRYSLTPQAWLAYLTTWLPQDCRQWGDIPYSLNNESADRQSPGNVMTIFPNASLFYTQQLSDSVSAGIGLYGNYGLGIDFGNWAGDRLIKKVRW